MGAIGMGRGRRVAVLIGRWPIGWGSIAASSSPMDPGQPWEPEPGVDCSGLLGFERGEVRGVPSLEWSDRVRTILIKGKQDS